MFDTEHMGIRWGYIFLRTASGVTEEEKEDLMLEACEMYLFREEERLVKGENYQGRLFTEGKYELVGSFGGIRFDAELETPYGRDHMKFIINEQTRRQGPAYSIN